MVVYSEKHDIVIKLYVKTYFISVEMLNSSVPPLLAFGEDVVLFQSVISMHLSYALNNM